MAGLLDTLGSDEVLGGLLSAGAASGAKGNFLSRMAQGLQAGDRFSQGRREEARQRSQDEMRAEYQKLLQMKMQREEEQAQRAETQAAAKQAALPGLFAGRQIPGQISTPTMGGIEMFSQGSTQTPARTDGAGQVDFMKALQAGYTPDEIAKLSGLPNLGKPKVTRIETVNVGGKPMKVGVDEYGQQVAQIGMEWRPLKTQDMGGFIGAFDETNPDAGIRNVGAKTQTPESLASNAVSMRGQDITLRGQNMTNDRALQRLALDQGAAVSDSGGPSQSAFVKQFGKASPGYRWKADGSQEFIPGGPADQKALMQKSGEGTVGSVVADLRDKYSQLDAGGGLVNADNGILSNLMARSGASAVGQTLGGAVGTKNQSARDAIEMTRPLLLQAIMKATGMSAKQMDSNAELRLYLSTATDPTKGKQANMEALDRIEKLYGGGAQPTEPDRKKPGRTVVKTGTYGGKKVIQYSDGSTEYAD